MQQLRLQGIYRAYHSQLELPMNQQLEGHDLIAQLVQSEQFNRALGKQRCTSNWLSYDYQLPLSRLNAYPPETLPNSNWPHLLKVVS